jgi:hypothetical protein
MESACLPDGRRAGDLDGSEHRSFCAATGLSEPGLRVNNQRGAHQGFVAENRLGCRSRCCQERQYDRSQYSDILEDAWEFHLLPPSKSCGGKPGAILQRQLWPYNQVRTARTEAITFSAKGTNFHLPQFPKSSYSYLRSAIH